MQAHADINRGGLFIAGWVENLPWPILNSIAAYGRGHGITTRCLLWGS